MQEPPEHGRLAPTAPISGSTDLAGDDPTRPTLAIERESLTGRVLAERYEVREPIGRGGMGAVYAGWQRGTEREVAIKVIARAQLRDRDASRRFLREMRLAGRISHPGVVAVHDAGATEDDILYLVMERVPGRTLAAALASGPMRPERAIALGAQLCDALDAAHRAGVIHRDLKPSNIMLVPTPGGEAIKVLDLGLAKSLHVDADALVTQEQSVLGTPTYMAPEQVRGEPCDPRVDLYALGVILHEMVAGRPPFVARSVHEVMAMHLNESPPVIDRPVPPRLVALIRRLLAKRPEARPSSAAEVGDELRSAMLRPGRPWWWIAAAILCAAVVIGVVVREAATRGDRTVVSIPMTRIVIETAPPGATVWIDGARAGTTPLSVDRPRGDTVEVRFELDGHRGLTQRLPLLSPTLVLEMTLAPSGPDAVAPQ